jgi:hypothetical protein
MRLIVDFPNGNLRHRLGAATDDISVADSVAELSQKPKPIAHDRTSRGKSDQAICKRMNKLRMSPVDCQRTVIYVGDLS